MVEASKAGLKVEGYEAPAKVIQDIERIVRAAGIDVGGIEYIVDDRDGNIYYYDINALFQLRRGRASSHRFQTRSKILLIIFRTRCVVPAKKGIRYGYWMPVFGGWLRNVEDEQMEASWQYTSKLAQRSEQIGFDLSLIAELNMNDIKASMRPASTPGRPRRPSRRSPNRWN